MYEIFAELLKKKGVTPYQVHKATGVAQSSLSDWKNGKSKPKYEKMQKIADYFGVSVDYLLGNEPKEKPAGQTTDEPNEKILKFVEILRELPEDKLDLVIEMSKALRGEK